MAEVFRVQRTKDFTIMSNHHFKNKNLSLKAKGLLSLMLSLPENWDYTIKGLTTLSKDGRDSVISALKELEVAGYLVRKRMRNAKGQVSDTEYIISETPMTENPTQDKPTQDKPITEFPAQDFPTQSNTYKSKTKILNTQSINHSSNSTQQKGNVENSVENYDEVVESVKEQIEYDILRQKYSDSSQLDEIVSIMTEVMMSDKDITINSRKIPCNMIHNIYQKIDSDCIVYVIDSVDEYSKRKKINNIKGYLITALYNAPMTISTYYSAECNYDMENRNIE